MERLWKYFAVTILAFCLVGVYAMAAFNLKVFNPIAEILDDYSFTDFYYKLQAGAGVQDTSRIVTIVDMTELRKRRDFADLFMEVNALKPKAVGVDVVFEGYKEEDLRVTPCWTWRSSNCRTSCSPIRLSTAWRGRPFTRSSPPATR